ncbi:MAG TPA: DUF5335 family protein [Pyrinomonadaceae bacterium]|nr:DUF5335 family protein [Acidobacteriota bacterium]HQZ96860.1 DUF5335 family protein [Pyrinomonadaceae bacterium]
MKNPKRINEWTKFLQFFSEQNAGRPTRLAVFERHGENVMDYWLESGLPLGGVDIDTHQDRATIQISLGEFNHTISDATGLKFVFSRAGDEDGLDVTDAEGRTAVLRFQVGGAVG